MVSTPSKDKVWVPFKGDSMKPVLRTGDDLLVDLEAPKHYKNGDIIVLKYGGEWVAHRIVKEPMRSGENFILKGDFSLHTHEFVPYSDLSLGLVIGMKRAQRMTIWGREGQGFKKIFSWLSIRAQEKQSVGRYFSLGCLKILNFIESLSRLLRESLSINRQS